MVDIVYRNGAAHSLKSRLDVLQPSTLNTEHEISNLSFSASKSGFATNSADGNPEGRTYFLSATKQSRRSLKRLDPDFVPLGSNSSSKLLKISIQSQYQVV
jgi:hypothetical protein